MGAIRNPLRSDGTQWLKARPHRRANKTKMHRSYMIKSQTSGGWIIEAYPDWGLYSRLEDAIKALDLYLDAKGVVRSKAD
jgi:hypothetical protein